MPQSSDPLALPGASPSTPAIGGKESDNKLPAPRPLDDSKVKPEPLKPEPLTPPPPSEPYQGHPVEIVPGEAVNLADEGGILVSGDFDAGLVLPLTLTFGDGSTTELNVPVVTACDHYEGLDLTQDSENIPYDCDFEAPPAGGEEEH